MQKKKEFQTYVNEMSVKLKKKEIELTSVIFREVCYDVVLKDSDGAMMTWQIAQRFGFENTNALPEMVTQAFNRGDIGLLPRGGVAYLKDWGTGEYPSIEHKLFCFLPLLVKTGLPVHINGHFALDHENRHGLWPYGNDSFKMLWNKSLMEGVIAPAYCKIIGAARDSIKQLTSPEEFKLRINQYFDLFPNISEPASYVGDMSKSVYKYIADHNSDVLPVKHEFQYSGSHEWASLCDGGIYFDNLDNGYESVISAIRCHQKDIIITQTLVRCGFRVFFCPRRLRNNFQISGITVKIVNADAVLNFFAKGDESLPTCENLNLPRHISETKFENIESFTSVLEYCTTACNYKRRLNGSPFLLTADNILRRFDYTEPKFNTNFSDIMPHALDKFILPTVTALLKLHTRDCELCKPFTILEFAKLLPDLLPPDTCCGSEYVLASEMSLHVGNFPVWLRRVWEFICSFLSTEPSKMDGEFATILKPLMSWYLFPVVCNKQEMLYPLCKTKSVLVPQQTEFFQKYTVIAFEKLQMAQPDLSFVYSADESTRIRQQQIFSKWMGNFEKAISVLLALENIMQMHSLDGKLDANDCVELLAYFSSTIDQCEKFHRSSSILKELPFYETFDGHFVSLKYDVMYILPSEIPQSGVEKLTAIQSLVFLKEHANLSDLMKFLRSVPLSVCTFYCKFVFKYFSLLDHEEKILHLTFVKNFFFQLKKF